MCCQHLFDRPDLVLECGMRVIAPSTRDFSRKSKFSTVQSQPPGRVGGAAPLLSHAGQNQIPTLWGGFLRASCWFFQRIYQTSMSCLDCFVKCMMCLFSFRFHWICMFVYMPRHLLNASRNGVTRIMLCDSMVEHQDQALKKHSC